MRKSLRLQRVKRIRRPPPGTAPGFISVPEDALKLSIRSFMYTNDIMKEADLHNLDEIKNQLQGNPDKVHWFDIKGFGNKIFLEQLADFFGIHRLQMEDVVNVYQRPKVEDLQDHLFFICRVLKESENGYINDQLSIFLGRNYVITIQDKYDDILDPVRLRIRLGKGYLRRSGADYLV
jgi:magnesium transporter